MRSLLKNILIYIGNIYFYVSKRIKKNTPSVRVLIYHDIPHGTEDQFRSHFEVLKKSFDFITPGQFHDYLEGKFLPVRDSLLVTFDDGFESSFTVTTDILETFGIRALFLYVPDLSIQELQVTGVVTQVNLFAITIYLKMKSRNGKDQ